MKLRTSYFNSTVLRKDLTRFAPVWTLYTVFWFLIIYLNIFDRQSDALVRARDWEDMSSFMGFFNLFYGGITAALLLSDLFNSRMCNALHAMPMRREGWLLTHSISGALFALIPYGLSTVFLVILMPEYAFVALAWFAVAMLEFLFFFSLALLAGMCAGSFLGMAAVYFILNFFFLLVYALYALLYEPLLFGISLNINDHIVPLIPVVQLTDGRFLYFHYSQQAWKISWECWNYLLLCTCFTPVAWILSFLLYRKRKLESAGDFISFRPMAPVFLIFYTLGVGAVLYAIPFALGNSVTGYIFLGVGLLIGYFTGKMLLEKTLRVFHPKTFLGFTLLVGIISATLGLTKLDPLGVTYYIPEPETLTGMKMYSDENTYMYNTGNTSLYLFTEETDIARLQTMHLQMLQDREETDPNMHTCNVTVEYFLKNGRTCKRYYEVDPSSSLGQDLEKHLSDYRSVFFTDDLDEFIAQLDTVQVNYYDPELALLPLNEDGEYCFTKEQLPDLIAAIKADCDAGFMAQDSAYTKDADFLFWLYWETTTEGENSLRIYNELRLTDKCKNTLAYFKTIQE